MMKKYNLGKLKVNKEEKTVFIKDNSRILSLNDVEDLLNDQDNSLMEMCELKKRNDSLASRVSKLRKELDDARLHQSDNEKIKSVCRIIQNRIDFVDNEPVAQHVCEHMKTIKNQLIENGLWRT